MAAADLVGLDAQSLTGDAPLKAAGKSRLSRPTRTRVGTSGQASSGHGSVIGVHDC